MYCDSRSNVHLQDYRNIIKLFFILHSNSAKVRNRARESFGTVNFNSEDEASRKNNFDQPSGEFMIMRFTFQVLVPSKSIVNTTVAMNMWHVKCFNIKSCKNSEKARLESGYPFSRFANQIENHLREFWCWPSKRCKSKQNVSRCTIALKAFTKLARAPRFRMTKCTKRAQAQDSQEP